MASVKKIPPQAVLALKEALSVIYWKKEDLQQFLKLALNHNAIVHTVSWDGTKREAVKELVERMINRLDIYEEDLTNLFLAVSDFSDFGNLKFWDEDGSKLRKAKDAVERLRLSTKGYLQLSKDQEEVQKRRAESEKRILQKKSLAEELEGLRLRFEKIARTTNFQKRGYELEKFLYDLFLLYELEPKGSFKIHGEQIDGAFTFQGADYLLEAKWKNQVDRGQIAAFCFKVENKFKTAVGLLVTIDGVTPEAISPNFKSIIIMDGLDLATILEGRISLPDLLFRKRRTAIETGNIYQNIHQL